MRKAINIFFIAIFILTACNNSNSNKVSEKEAELQKKEQDLKERELELDERASKQNSNPSEVTKAPSAPKEKTSVSSSLTPKLPSINEAVLKDVAYFADGAIVAGVSKKGDVITSGGGLFVHNNKRNPVQKITRERVIDLTVTMSGENAGVINNRVFGQKGNIISANAYLFKNPMVATSKTNYYLTSDCQVVIDRGYGSFYLIYYRDSKAGLITAWVNEKDIQVLDKDNAPVSSNSEYNFSSHGNFKSFWQDFQKAILTNDRQAVAKMTHYPFRDAYQEVYYNSSGGKKPLTASNENEFINNYDKIIYPSTINSVQSNEIRAYEYNDMIDGDVIKKGEFLLSTSVPNSDRSYNLAFSKKNGVYKLSYIPYSE
ncbi:MAG: hypothetical protein KF706_10820 [Chitinophagales bacterium]|nr:hypothetical protein [Chitinophagales bacterium]